MCGPFVVDNEISCGSIVEVTLKTAIDAHLRWKDSLENYVCGFYYSERPSVDCVAADDRCLLGKWIHGPGRESFSRSEVFRDLVQAHAEFHGHAARIVAAMQRNDLGDAMAQLQVGDYPRSSAEVKLLLARLYVEALCRSDGSAAR